MLRPAYKLALAQQTMDTTGDPRTSTVVNLIVALDMDTPTNSCTVVLGQVGRLESQRGDAFTLDLGYADSGELRRVLTADIATIEHGLTNARVIAHDAGHSLVHSFADVSLEDQSAGAIVRALATQAGVDVDTADEGIQFPAYVIDSRRSLYEHMRRLAELSGFDLYINAGGALVFREFLGGSQVHTFEFARDVLDLQVESTPPAANTVEAFGESPGPGRGAEAWAWLTKDFSGSKGTSGAEPPVMLLKRSVLRTADAAQQAADAARRAIQRRSVRGRLLTIGRPDVQLGDAIRLTNVPQSALNGTFQVRNITHRVRKTHGFETSIGFQSIARAQRGFE